MPIDLQPGCTVMFTGDSITDCQRSSTEEGLGFGYPLRVAGEWDLHHPDRRVSWLNSGHRGDKVMDLEARWRTDVLDEHPDVVSILVGINDMGWHTMNPDAHPVSAEAFAAGYCRLLAPLAAANAQLVLIEPFLLPISGTVEAGCALVDEHLRAEWRVDLEPKIQVVRQLASEFNAHLIAADDMFAGLTATATPEHWSTDGVHPTPAGHAALAAAWLQLVA